MRATQSCKPLAAQADFRGTVLHSHSGPCLALDGVERVLMETRSRILGALDRELDQIRASYQAQMDATHRSAVAGPESEEGGVNLMAASPVPQNVLTVSRELFIAEAPQEVVLDPALERATVEELNAALADAFNHVSGR